MAADGKNAMTAFHDGTRHAPADAVPMAPLPDHGNVNSTWWQALWDRHAHITTPLRRRGLQCDIEFGLSAYMVCVALPDDSYLIVSPPQEPPSSRPPGDPEGWTVTRQHPCDHELFEFIYDSVPSADPGAPERPEVRNGGSASHLIEAIDQRLAQLGLLHVSPSPTGSPLVYTAPRSPAPEPLDLFNVAQDGTLHDSDIIAASETAGPSAGSAARTDRTTTYVYGDALLALTDRLNGTESYAETAALLGQVLEPTHGLLERLGEFFEAAGEKAKEAEQDEGFDLSYDLADAAAEMRNLGEVLHVAEDRMRTLTAPPQSHRPAASPTHASRLPVPALAQARPQHTR
ncbi:hypothetical protein [Streptomyces sp. NPDC088725]|uniref:hypothetical protein n=1 Tax=Streptomyces sp. NPDC088725 TaxID=3365873 RepID=UPI0037FC4C77